jgi:cytochrome c oxidase subunit 2
MPGSGSVLAPAGPQAADIAAVTWVFFAVCGAVYVLVLGAVAVALARRRSGHDETPAAEARLTRVVTGASVVTAVVLAVLTWVSFRGERRVQALPQDDALEVTVLGRQWWWEFQYPGSRPTDFVSSPNELHIPVGRKVLLTTISRDVIHSFWVPSLHGKRDLVPGMPSKTWFQADHAGVYRGLCAEFCGHQHAHMAFAVVAEPPAQFEAWLRGQRQPAAAPSDADASRGHDVFMRGTCVMCHAVRGTDAGSRIGPDLTHVASRRTLASGTLPMTREQLTRWIADPQAIKPGVRMPPQPLGDADLAAVVAYLESLR